MEDLMFGNITTRSGPLTCTIYEHAAGSVVYSVTILLYGTTCTVSCVKLVFITVIPNILGTGMQHALATCMVTTSESCTPICQM